MSGLALVKLLWDRDLPPPALTQTWPGGGGGTPVPQSHSSALSELIQTPCSESGPRVAAALSDAQRLLSSSHRLDDKKSQIPQWLDENVGNWVFLE